MKRRRYELGAAVGLAMSLGIQRPSAAGLSEAPSLEASAAGRAMAPAVPPLPFDLVGAAVQGSGLLSRVLDVHVPPRLGAAAGAASPIKEAAASALYARPIAQGASPGVEAAGRRLEPAGIRLEKLQRAVAADPRAAEWILELNYSQTKLPLAFEDDWSPGEPVALSPRGFENSPLQSAWGGLSKLLRRAPPGPKAIPDVELQPAHAARFAGDMLDLGNMVEHVKVLSGEKPVAGGARLSNRYSEKNKLLARAYLDRRLAEMGYEPRHERLDAVLQGHPLFLIPDERRKIVNVIAEIKGAIRPEEVVEVVAHYDTANPAAAGADDNGSGVAAVLEMARVFKNLSPARTLRFVFVDLEEAGSVGSRAHVEKLARSGDKLAAAVVLDMIGYHPEIPNKLSDVTIGRRAENKAVAGVFFRQERLYGERAAKLFPLTLTANPYATDHGSYWAKGLPAVYIGQNHERFNPHMHGPKDTLSKMNPEYMAGVARLVFEGVAVLSGARVPDSLAKEFGEKAPAYEAAYRPQPAGADFVAKARPLLRLLGRLWRMNKGRWFKKRLAGAARMYKDMLLPWPPRKSGLDRLWEKELKRIARLHGALSVFAPDSPRYYEHAAGFLIDAHLFARKWNVPEAELGPLLDEAYRDLPPKGRAGITKI